MRKCRTTKKGKDLPHEIIKQIMIHVAKAEKGAKDIARFACVSKKFNEFRNDRDILKCVDFGDDGESYIYPSFWNQRSLYAKSVELEAFQYFKNSSETQVEHISETTQSALNFWCFAAKKILVSPIENMTDMIRPHTRSVTRRRKMYKERLQERWKQEFVSIQELKLEIFKSFPRGLNTSDSYNTMWWNMDYPSFLRLLSMRAETLSSLAS